MLMLVLAAALAGYGDPDGNNAPREQANAAEMVQAGLPVLSGHRLANCGDIEDSILPVLRASKLPDGDEQGRASLAARLAQLHQQLEECLKSSDAADAAGAKEKQERAAQVTASDDRRKLIETRRRDPVWAVPAFSAAICAAKNDESSTRAAIAKAKKRARQVGVADLQELFDFGQQLKTDDDTREAFEQRLKALHAKPLPCSNKLVGRLAACVPIGDHDLPDSCDDKDLGDSLVLINAAWDD